MPDIHYTSSVNQRGTIQPAESPITSVANVSHWVKLLRFGRRDILIAMVFFALSSILVRRFLGQHHPSER